MYSDGHSVFRPDMHMGNQQKRKKEVASSCLLLTGGGSTFGAWGCASGFVHEKKIWLTDIRESMRNVYFSKLEKNWFFVRKKRLEVSQTVFSENAVKYLLSQSLFELQ